MKAVGLLLLIVIITMAVSCNSEKIRPTEKNSIENTQKTDYPPPSENAAEVQIEEVAISPQPLAAESFNSDENYQSQRASQDYNFENQIPPSPRESMNNTTTASSLDKDTNSFGLPSPERTTHRQNSFKSSQSNIGRVELEKQKEYERDGSGTGAMNSVFSSSSGTSQDNVGPKINIGAKIKNGPPDGSNRREGNATDLGKIQSQAESSNWSEPNLSMSSEDIGTKNKNPLAGYEPPKEALFNEKDDDIVARQIQEAASAEQDPALREKLWKEYERYRSGL
tara:strand:+ start:139 stop:981 length:843 start_codon:yes stop_codon:yes gene_type:complete